MAIKTERGICQFRNCTEPIAAVRDIFIPKVGQVTISMCEKHRKDWDSKPETTSIR